MTIRHFDDSCIKHVNSNRLVYEDGNGEEHIILFEDCFESYRLAHLSEEALNKGRQSINEMSDEDWERQVEVLKSQKYVGDRNILEPPWADGPYIEFFTEPPIRFRFATVGEFHKLRTFLERSGWRTGDRS